MNKVDKFIVLSQNAKNNLINLGDFPEAKIEVIYPGSDFKSIVSTNPFVRLNIKEPEFYIVCISRWQRHKNVEGLIEGYYKFLSTNPESNIKLIIVGKPVDNYDVPMKKFINIILTQK